MDAATKARAEPSADRIRVLLPEDDCCDASIVTTNSGTATNEKLQQQLVHISQHLSDMMPALAALPQLVVLLQLLVIGESGRPPEAERHEQLLARVEQSIDLKLNTEGVLAHLVVAVEGADRTAQALGDIFSAATESLDKFAAAQSCCEELGAISGRLDCLQLSTDGLRKLLLRSSGLVAQQQGDMGDTISSDTIGAATTSGGFEATRGGKGQKEALSMQPDCLVT